VPSGSEDSEVPDETGEPEDSDDMEVPDEDL